MTSDETRELLERWGALLSGHFVLSSGRHSDTYVEKFRALEHPKVAWELGSALAASFSDAAIDVVLAPAVGAVILGFTTAAALGTRSIFAERVEGEMTLRRGFEIGQGERVLVVEDVVTTGKSLMEVVRLVPGDQLAGIGCLADRSGGVELPLPLRALSTIEAVSWPPEECPLCAQGVPLTDRGSRRLGAPQ